jgi:hypothetical protein
VPRWAIGTFRGYTDAGEAELSIFPDGTATTHLLSNNKPNTGRYYNGVLTFDWGSYDLFREGNGIRTSERGNQGRQTSYRRVSGVFPK